jgi:cell cycle arrest protein BUB3
MHCALWLTPALLCYFLFKVLWDGMNKKKLTALPSFPSSIAAIAFNLPGTELAIASSYTHEEGDREHPQDEIFVRPISDAECLPKEK